MAKKFAELAAQISPERRAKIDEKVRQAMAEMHSDSDGRPGLAGMQPVASQEEAGFIRERELASA